MGDSIRIRTDDAFERLPSEIIFNILLRLPVKCLGKCRCVRKSWLTLISSHEFVHDHLRLSISSKTDGIVVLLGNTKPADADDDLNFSDDDAFWFDEETKFYEFYLYSFDLDSPDSRAVKLPMPRKYDRPYLKSSEIHVIGSCNGMLCIIMYPESELILLNPTIKTFFEIPKPPQICDHSGNAIQSGEFGYDPVKDDYKLLILISAHRYPDEDPELLIYSFNSNSWRAIGRVKVLKEVRWYFKATFIETHLLHWINDDNIECFNICDEQWSQLPLPNYLEAARVTNFYFLSGLGNLDGCLCLFAQDTDTIKGGLWVMKEYGVSQSWMKLYDVCDEILVEGMWSSPLAYYRSMGDEILLGIELPDVYKEQVFRLYWYNFQKKTVRPAEHYVTAPKFTNLYICWRSLISIPGSRQYSAELIPRKVVTSCARI